MYFHKEASVQLKFSQQAETDTPLPEHVRHRPARGTIPKTHSDNKHSEVPMT